MIRHSRQEVLLAEYKAAQSSAQHHDRLLWTVTSILCGGSLALMGIILKNSPMKGVWGVVSFLLCVLGLILTVLVWFAQRQFRRLRKHRYDRCKEIEEVLNMNLHRATVWKEGSQTIAYSATMVLFIIAWYFIAMSVLWNLFD
jgi:hypothetical protein